MKKTIYALGFFDGVHRGHAALLTACRQLARRQQAQAGVVTFAHHPEELVLGQAPRLINTIADRQRILSQYAQPVLTLPFDRQMQNMSWQDFLQMLIREQAAAGFVCGEDFRFGAQGAGNAALLEQFCREQGLPCTVVPEQTVEGIRVSSTYIRQQLETGDMATAVAFLGHPHIFTGQVIHGQALGRKLGIPTANLRLPEELVVPAFGVYACRAWVAGKVYPAVTNVGTRPTVEGHSITVEPWLLDYQGDLYDHTITLGFYRFLRKEEKFPSLQALQAQIHRDAEQTRLFLAGLAEEEFTHCSTIAPCFAGENRL